MEAEKTKLMISTERQKVLEKEAETIRKQNVIKAQTEAEISKINQEKEINEQETKKKISQIENQMYLERIKNEADAAYYKQLKEIEASQKRLTPAYLKSQWMNAFTNNTKVYFGESIPKYLSVNDYDKVLSVLDDKNN